VAFYLIGTKGSIPPGRLVIVSRVGISPFRLAVLLFLIIRVVLLPLLVVGPAVIILILIIIFPRLATTVIRFRTGVIVIPAVVTFLPLTIAAVVAVAVFVVVLMARVPPAR
jgi:hypothetical protein